ncbi:hypothetical protein SAMN02927924_02792 [Sphingobium faniae]|nr:hypothetical protein SAMN02927924_02792 [Sphingobium faniae]
MERRFLPITRPMRLAPGQADQDSPSPKAQRVELRHIEDACATIGDPTAGEAALRAAFLAIGSALCTEKQRNAARDRRIRELEAALSTITKRGL